MNKYEEALEEVLENGGYLDNGKDDYKAPKLLREAIKGNNALQRMYEAGITYDSVRALKQERDDALNHIKELHNLINLLIDKKNKLIQENQVLKDGVKVYMEYDVSNFTKLKNGHYYFSDFEEYSTYETNDDETAKLKAMLEVVEE